MKTVLVLCHGNINRSPLCATTLREHVTNWVVTEAALKSAEKPSWKPERASKKMRGAALELGLNLERHRSKAITKEMLNAADLVVYMDAGNLKRLQEFAGSEDAPPGQSWVCLGGFADPIRNRIPDPAFIARGTKEFHDVVQLIHSASLNLAKKLIAH